MSDTLLVTGASGQLGRRVIAHLLQTEKIPAARIIATTRQPESLAELAAQGVIVRKADFEEPASLVQAFTGAQRLLLVSTDALDRPGRRLEQHLAAVAAAVKAGVKHVVYTSMPKPEPGSPIPFAPDHFGTEQALAASPLTWTVLRNSWYMENLQMNLPQVLASGHWYTAAGEGRIAYISRDDCARAAAAALASKAGEKAVYNITGSAAQSTVQIAAMASETFGQPIAVTQVTAQGLAQGMAAAGVPAFLVPLLVAFDVNTAAGNLAAISDDFHKLTGAARLSLQEFLKANKTALAA